ncbi:MAG: amidohydrolase family protein [Bryobacteraceae bacterium]|nr:amidohydrolase family protein [Bryobacteraceae bacterium]
MPGLTRREVIALTAPFIAAAQQADSVFEPHVHLFAADLTKYPKHPNGPALTPAPLETYIPLAKQLGIRHAIHVSAEPYQDDTSYLEYTLTHAPAGFLKGIVLLDTVKADTPQRLEALARKYPKQLLGFRIHCVRSPGEPPTAAGTTIRNRDLFHPQAKLAWKKAADLGLWVQPHIMPWFAPDIAKLAREYSGAHVIIDHFGHAGVNGQASYGYRDPRDFAQVAALAKVPNIVMKVSGLRYSSREEFPHKDLQPLLRQAFDAFGPDRLIWGSFGTKPESFASCEAIWKEHFGFVSAADRRKIRYENGRRLFGF